MSEPNRHKDRWFPHVTVAAVIEQDNHFLMVRENLRPPVLNQPAGHLEQGETLLQAIEREVLEETAYRFRAEFLLGIYRWTNAQQQTYVRFCFSGTTLEHTTQALDPDIQAALWLDLDAIQQQPARSPLVMQCINDYCMGKRYALSVLHEFI